MYRLHINSFSVKNNIKKLDACKLQEICKNPSLLTIPLPRPMEALHSRTNMKFYSNKDTRNLRATLARGIVLFDQQNRGPQFIQSHL